MIFLEHLPFDGSQSQCGILHLWRHVGPQIFRYGNISDFRLAQQGCTTGVRARYMQCENISTMASDVSGIGITHSKALENIGFVLNFLQLSDFSICS